MSTLASEAAIVPPSPSRVLRAFGDELTVHLGGAETGGRYCMFTSVTQPGGGPPPHIHDREDEWFLVVDGQAEFFLDDRWTAAEVGTAVFLPRGVPHTFRNAGQSPLTLMIQTSPAGFDTFFGRCAAEFAREGGPDMARILAIAAEHGIRFLGPSE